MLTAVDQDGRRLSPTKDTNGFCPLCSESVVAKIGRCRVPRPHWAHRANTECDPWLASDGESDWHRAWKELVIPERREVVLTVGSERHFADILGEGTTIVEIQRSPIGGEKIIERAHFYNNFDRRSRLVWVFHAVEFAERLVFRRHPEREERVVFRWERPRDSHRVASNNAQVFWDFGHAFLFKPNSFEQQAVWWKFRSGEKRLSYYDGYGEVWTRSDFARVYLAPSLDKPGMLARLNGHTPPMPGKPFDKLRLTARMLETSRDQLRQLCAT